MTPSNFDNVFVSQHPIVAEKIALIRDQKTDTKRFRELLKECGTLLGYEATADLKITETLNCQGVLSSFTGYTLADKIALVPILRAGLGLVDPFLELVPFASVFHLGIFREKMTLSPVEYYNKLPSVHDYDLAILLDPMLATGGTAVAAIDILKEWGVKKIKLVSICASTKGISVVNKAHPDVSVHVGVIDEQLSSTGYILPGFGDAGDRLFNTGVNSTM